VLAWNYIISFKICLKVRVSCNGVVVERAEQLVRLVLRRRAHIEAHALVVAKVAVVHGVVEADEGAVLRAATLDHSRRSVQVQS
jgi:hypothetical protein